MAPVSGACVMGIRLTSELSSALYHLIDLFQTVQQLLMIIAAHVVAVDQIVVQVKQLQITLTHSMSANNQPRVQ